eukprot:8320370-Pyramimonas_sp.AAC.1
MSLFVAAGTGASGSPGQDPRKRPATEGSADEDESQPSDFQIQIDALRAELLEEVAKTSSVMQGSLNSLSSK